MPTMPTIRYRAGTETFDDIGDATAYALEHGWSAVTKDDDRAEIARRDSFLTKCETCGAPLFAGHRYCSTLCETATKR